jgi:hypothetical protein
MAVFFRSAVDKSSGNPALLEEIASEFTECGPQVVEIDVEDSEDVYPERLSSLRYRYQLGYQDFL